MKQIILAFALIISFQSRGQITFIDSNTPWNELSKQATEQDKLIFIHFENSECVQCNEVASQGFSGKDLKELFDDNFISIRCNVGTPNGLSLARKFAIRSSLMSLFVDASGNILHVNNGSTGYSGTYESGAELALSRKGQKQLADYDKDYKAGVRGLVFLREYMTKKREASMPVDQLLDEYVAFLPIDSLANYQSVQTILALAPALNSAAYKAITTKTPPSLLDSIFLAGSPDNRRIMREGIIGNTFRLAVWKRDEQLAVRTAEFARDVQRKGPSKGQVEYAKTMVQYYYQTRDTLRYLEQAVQLMESHYMPLTVDSLNKMDDAAFHEQNTAFTTKRGKPEQGIVVRSMAMMPPSQFIYKDLNEHAYHFYELTRDKALLEKALAWSKKSMELGDSKGRRAQTPFKLGDPNWMDTYAHILYRLDRRDEAIEWQTKAMEAQKISGMAYQSFEIRLNKMKAGTL
ncbi:MAG: thioredoxin family protein [Dyadobacter fermentans]